MSDELKQNEGEVSVAKTPVESLKKLKQRYSPDINPLVEPDQISIRRKKVRSGIADRTLVDIETGEITAASVIHSIEEKDDAQFVKVFADGIARSYGLSTTGQRVFQAVLHEYEQTPMHGGFADSVYVAWFGVGLSGRNIGMSEKTFSRGFRELLDKHFISPRLPNTYWVNPALFFKGDRVLFVREYRRVRSLGTTSSDIDDHAAIDGVSILIPDEPELIAGDVEPVKRGRGRPKGSKNKVMACAIETEATTTTQRDLF